MTSRPGVAVSGLGLGDGADPQVVERAAALGQRLQHLGEGHHPGHAPVIHHDQRADVVLGHDLHRVEHRRVRGRREQGIALDAQDLADQHAASSGRAPERWGVRLLRTRRRAQPPPAMLRRIRGAVHAPARGNRARAGRTATGGYL